MHLRRKNPINMGTIENTSMMSRAIAVNVVKRSRHTSGRPICGVYYIRKIKDLNLVGTLSSTQKYGRARWSLTFFV